MIDFDEAVERIHNLVLRIERGAACSVPLYLDLKRLSQDMKIARSIAWNGGPFQRGDTVQLAIPGVVHVVCCEADSVGRIRTWCARTPHEHKVYEVDEDSRPCRACAIEIARHEARKPPKLSPSPYWDRNNDDDDLPL